MTTNRTESGGSVKSVDRVFRIVEALQRLDGARGTELAAELDMANSTVHRYLKSLQENQYVVQEGDVYHVGMGFLDLGEYARNRKEVYRLAEEKVEQLAEETNERAEFIVEEYGHVVFVHRATGAHAIQADSHLGKQLPIHATSAGKAILAFLPENRRDAILDSIDLEAYTDNTITDREVLDEELASIRESGVAFNKREYIRGLNTVSVPVMDVDDRVCGALGISGPTNRMKGDRLHEEMPDLLLGTANELEINASYQ